MALAAATVVDALAARLLPMPATAGRVYTSRLWPLTEADLPAWRVTAEEEGVSPAQLDGVNAHSLLIEAACTTRATSDLDDSLHALAASGLALLFAGTVPFGLQLERIDRYLSQEGEASVGVVTLSLRALFFVAPSAPETILSA
jgi:hypothetical protein